MSSEGNLDWTYTVAERKIQEAMEAGEFDNLPGKGQPLDLESIRGSPRTCGPRTEFLKMLVHYPNGFNWKRTSSENGRRS
jgi:hypothetical protein